jgi:hypothetical protein
MRRCALVGAFVVALGAAVAAGVRLVRVFPLVDALPANDGGSAKKDDKKDMKKKGNGPRTRRKKAKKGKA